MVSVLTELSWHASVRLTVFYMRVNLPNGFAVTDTDFLWEDETAVHQLQSWIEVIETFFSIE